MLSLWLWSGGRLERCRGGYHGVCGGDGRGRSAAVPGEVVGFPAEGKRNLTVGIGRDKPRAVWKFTW